MVRTCSLERKQGTSTTRLTWRWGRVADANFSVLGGLALDEPAGLFPVTQDRAAQVGLHDCIVGVEMVQRVSGHLVLRHGFEQGVSFVAQADGPFPQGRLLFGLGDHLIQGVHGKVPYSKGSAAGLNISDRVRPVPDGGGGRRIAR